MKIEWTAKARKQLRKLGNQQAIDRIHATIAIFANGGSVDIINLTNHQYTHRIRVGDYRILITIDKEEIEISYIQEVKNRDDNTY
jgi:mRNA-degrading endonuclease RelE of RelBE toxin-antitoxin system